MTVYYWINRFKVQSKSFTDLIELHKFIKKMQGLGYITNRNNPNNNVNNN